MIVIQAILIALILVTAGVAVILLILGSRKGGLQARQTDNLMELIKEVLEVTKTNVAMTQEIILALPDEIISKNPELTDAKKALIKTRSNRKAQTSNSKTDKTTTSKAKTSKASPSPVKTETATSMTTKKTPSPKTSNQETSKSPKTALSKTDHKKLDKASKTLKGKKLSNSTKSTTTKTTPKQ